MRDYDERVLEDDYPVHAGYAYVVDGKPVISDVTGTVADLKRALNAQEVRRCDLIARLADAKGR